jgi:hypothetical protein
LCVPVHGAVRVDHHSHDKFHLGKDGDPDTERDEIREAYRLESRESTGHKPIHMILGSNGIFWTLDESMQVRTGSFYAQNTTTIFNNGSRYIFGSFAGSLTTRGPGNILGVVTGSGTTAGDFSGTVDFINGGGSFPGTTAGGSYGATVYTSLDSTTDRGTGVVTFTNGNTSSSTNIVIYVFRRISFLVLDVQSTEPDVG